MRVHIKLFARLREQAGLSRCELDINNNGCVSDVLAALRQRFPPLAADHGPIIVAVNQQFATLDHPVRAGDEIALFPPVSGGTDLLRVVQEPINVDDVVRALRQPEMGALAIFVGLVRASAHGRQVIALEYETYEEMTLTKLQQLAQEARTRWPAIGQIAIVQRVGRLAVGETAVVIGVTSPHRQDGCFEACRFAIDRLKQIVPIWKKEISPDGDVWIEGNYLPGSGD